MNITHINKIAPNLYVVEIWEGNDCKKYEAIDGDKVKQLISDAIDSDYDVDFN